MSDERSDRDPVPALQKRIIELEERCQRIEARIDSLEEDASQQCQGRTPWGQCTQRARHSGEC